MKTPEEILKSPKTSPETPVKLPRNSRETPGTEIRKLDFGNSGFLILNFCYSRRISEISEFLIFLRSFRIGRIPIDRGHSKNFLQALSALATQRHVRVGMLPLVCHGKAPKVEPNCCQCTLSEFFAHIAHGKRTHYRLGTSHLEPVEGQTHHNLMGTL